MEIVSLPIVFGKERLDSRFRLVIIATERARRLIAGAKPCVPLRYLKESTVALEEIVSCNIEVVTGQDARSAVREAIAGKGSKPGDVRVEAVEEDATKKEIEKDLSVYIDDSAGSTESGKD